MSAVFPLPPPDGDVETLLDAFAPFAAIDLCPSLSAFAARSLVEVWEAAERMAGVTLQAPFWAFPWPAGIGLAHAVLDRPELVEGLDVIDVGAGGGVAAFACARAGARRVVACDIDPWALTVTRIGAARQGLAVETLRADVTVTPAVLDAFDVVLCGDLAYDGRSAAAERSALDAAAVRGATVLVADAGRTYFDPAGMQLMAELSLPVVQDLEGCERKTVRVFRIEVRTAPASPDSLRPPHG